MILALSIAVGVETVLLVGCVVAFYVLITSVPVLRW